MQVLETIVKRKLGEKDREFDKFKDAVIDESFKKNLTRFITLTKKHTKIILQKAEKYMIVKMDVNGVSTTVGYVLNREAFIDPQLMNVSNEDLANVFNTKVIYLSLGYPIVRIDDQKISLCLYSKKDPQNPFMTFVIE